MMMLSLKLAWQQLKANWRAGELRVLLMALTLAVAAIVTVNAFTTRVLGQLTNQGAELLGGDVVIKGDQPLSLKYTQQAKALNLNVANTAEFPSMVIVNEENQLAEIKALGQGFPLKGHFEVQFSESLAPRSINVGPNVGEVWVDQRLIGLLNLRIGQTVELGAKTLKVSGIVVLESSRGGDMFSFAPRVMMNMHDLVATELVQYGSRVKYQLVVAGEASEIKRYAEAIKPSLQKGERLEDVQTARPEIKSALDKATVFLGLSSMVAVVLAIVAMLLSVGPFISKSLDTFAMLRCLGSEYGLIKKILLWQTVLIATLGGLLGMLIGFGLQYGLSFLLGRLLIAEIGELSFQPFLLGFMVSYLVMLAMIWPYIRTIKSQSIMGILRRETTAQLNQDIKNYIPITLLILSLILWQASSFKMALILSAGLLVSAIVVALIAYAVIKAVFSVRLNPQSPKLVTVQLGLTNLKRHLRLSIAQIVAFSLALMVIIFLTIIKTDLMQSWKDSLPPDAPNRFVINLQKDQIESFTQQFKQDDLPVPQVFPMIRGRLTAINGKAVGPDDYEDERAKRLISREFNLSMASEMQADNHLVEGKWWAPEDAGKPFLSIEQDIAEKLNVKIDDTLSYDIAGSVVNLKVTSIRKVEWDTMRANFFAVTPPKVLEPYLASYLSAFYLPPNQALFSNHLVTQFKNITVIDVVAIMEQVRTMMDKMALAIAYVFALSLVSGIAVLYAALVATKSTRIYESTLLRALGASKQQVSMAMLAEFLCIGLIVSCVSIVLANVLAFSVSYFILDIPFHVNLAIALKSFVLVSAIIPAAAWMVVRDYLNIPPKQLLNSV
jgi:putative ABC transport system permease protein